MLDQGFPDLRGTSQHKVDHSGRHACLVQYFHKKSRRIWGIGRRLEHHRIAHDQSRKTFPGRNGCGKVPGGDQADHTERLSYRTGGLIGQFGRRNMPELSTAFSSHVIGHVNGLLDVTSRLNEDFAHFTR